MKPYQHFWGMTAILSALLLGNMMVGRNNAQPTAATAAAPDVLTAREIRPAKIAIKTKNPPAFSAGGFLV